MSQTEALSSLPYGIRGPVYQQSAFVVDQMLLGLVCLSGMIILLFFIFKRFGRVEETTQDRCRKLLHQISDAPVESISAQQLNRWLRQMLSLCRDFSALDLTSEQLRPELVLLFPQDEKEIESFLQWTDRISFSNAKVELEKLQYWHSQVLSWAQQISAMNEGSV